MQQTDGTGGVSPRLSRYHFPETADPNAANNALAFELHMIGNAKRVLEFGCASGHMTEALVNQGCRVVGLEFDAGAAAANTWAEEVLVVDLDRDDFVEKLRGREFDVALFGDVLEHLRDPLSVLQAARGLLTAGGFVVISVPNVAHIDVRLALLEGRFEYSDYGLLDRTHMRFFTRASVDRLLEDAGLIPVECMRTIAAPFEGAVGATRNVPQAAVDFALEDPEAMTFQFVLKAVLDDGDHAVHQLADRCRDLENELHAIRMETELAISKDRATGQAYAEHLERELQAVYNTKVMRYSAKARSVYRQLMLGQHEQ